MASVANALTGGMRAVGGVGESVARHAGAMAQLAWQSLQATVKGQVASRDFINQAFAMGVQSLPLVLVTATLSGVVTSQQGGYQFTGSIPLYVLGSIVVNGVVLELGPVMTAIVFIGRVGARITAELGTMQVSEQIDAIYSLGRDPVRMLGAPRILAGMLAMPALVGLANGVGSIAGMLAGRSTAGLGYQRFLYGARAEGRAHDPV